MLNYGDIFLIKYLGIVFVIASMMRIYLFDDRKKELVNFGLPQGFDYVIILSELIVGLFLLYDSSNVNFLMYLLIFLIIGTIFILINNFNKIIGEFTEVWTYQPTAMSLVFHFTYIILLIGLCINQKNK